MLSLHAFSINLVQVCQALLVVVYQHYKSTMKQKSFWSHIYWLFMLITILWDIFFYVSLCLLKHTRWNCRRAVSAILISASEKFQEAGVKILGSALLASQIVGLKESVNAASKRLWSQLCLCFCVSFNQSHECYFLM